VYHHFPDGKDQLVDAALGLAGDRALRMLDGWAGSSPPEITEKFLGMWRTLLSHTRFTTGCSVLAVTVATDSPELLNHAATIFRAWRARLAELFEEGGLEPRDAARVAAILVASSEGAVVLSRAEQSMEPFDLVAEQLIEQVQRMAAA
jgi:TetR/AcrR family transcriptional repressor of lmrAB and yxaGH operons